MADTDTQARLEERLSDLGARIAQLRQKMSGAGDPERSGELGEVEQLEQRHRQIQAQLQGLHAEGTEFRQDAKADIEKVADDLGGALDEFTRWVDSGYQADRRPQWRRKSEPGAMPR